jgi:hypothetical protein
MPKFSKKVMGKEVGDAEVYAAPHTMNGKAMTTAKDSVTKSGNGLDKTNISVAGISKGNYPPENRYGKMEMRGAGAATKGRMSSGKMG